MNPTIDTAGATALADLIDQWPNAHWVRCNPDKTPVNAKGWHTNQLHADVVTSWAATGNPVAIIPGSVGYVAMDVDAGDADRMIAELPPAYAVPSRRPGGMHLWYPHDGGDVHNRHWKLFGCSGDVRGHTGYLILWNPDGLVGAPAHNATPWDAVEDMIGRRGVKTQTDVMLPENTADAAGALAAIPADLPGYDDYLAVVIAAKASGIDSETVRAWTEGAADDQAGRRNKLQQWGAFWDGLTPTAIGPGTLFHFATLAGWQRMALPVWSTYEQTGRIGGDATPWLADFVVSVPEELRVISRHGNDKIALDRQRGDGYTDPDRSTDDYCIRFGEKVGRQRHSSGGAYRLAVDCRECGGDLRWWQMQKRHKYAYGQGDGNQSLVRVSGLATDDDAQTMLTAIGRTTGATGPRMTFSWRNPDSYLWEIAGIYADALGAGAVANLGRRRDRGPESHEWEIESRRVDPDELDAFMPTQSRTQRRAKDKPDGGHDPVRFVGWGKNRERLQTDYAWGDVDIGDDSDAIMELPTRDQVSDPEIEHLADKVSDHWAMRWVKNERRAVIHTRRWLDGVALDGDALLRLRTARLDGQRGDWFGCIAAGTYDGPRRLIIDLALSLDADAMAGLDSRAALRLAASYIVDGGS